MTRILLAGLFHETHTFVDETTGFAEYTIKRGPAILARRGDGSTIDPARSAVAGVLGPVEAGTSSVVRPFTAALDYFQDNDDLRADVARLSAQNSRLRTRAEQTPLDRNRLAELREAIQAWLHDQPRRPEHVKPDDWLAFEQEKHERLLQAA